MTEFCDSTGRTWALVLTLGSAKQIYDKLGVDLLNPTTMITTDEDGNPDMTLSTLPRLFVDDIFIGDIITHLVANQAEQRGIDEIELLNLFDGKTLKKAHEAFLKEYHNFFMERGNKVGMSLVESVEMGLKNLEQAELNGEQSSILPEKPESSPSTT